MRFLIVIVFCAAILTVQRLPFPKAGAESTGPQQGEVAEVFRDGKVNYEGVSFNFNKLLLAEVKGQTISESLASGDNDGPPDTIYSRHVAFEIPNVGSAPVNSFVKAGIRVYPVSEYKRAFGPGDTAKEVSATIARLQRLLRAQNASFQGAMPYLPLPDGYLAFRSHTALLHFNGGSGFVFVTQGQQDEMPINNQNLSYEFQGITDDGRYLITAAFPLAAPFLAYDRDRANYSGTVQECNCFDGPRYERFKREYRAYVSREKTKLDKLPADKFEPSLKLYNELLSSLQVTQKK